ncbi:uncharacterized protein MONBRDRAFT_23822 [Monosiga brevicollis MX1]|uniref:NUC153 domain-containing protein n=1 Tax=Monosiga brevicollis TaxID=81824 RepID=A9UUX8_MONBE|nr:uncharacterized protein MONBRDRAFT_23822 [Monosiga brevicollis MX1]EDQ90796.1 predicted protein [Monosiga brevicollis MX1]|eukprot:XP_001744093.1 hypothetical protein [Monosiga brevicollis MX1]
MSGMQLLELNDVRVFNLTAGKALPSWLSEKKRRQLLKRDVDLQRRIELIQDFEMPTAADCIRVSPDGEYIMAAGTYKPRIRCYDLDQMSLKFERHLNCEVVDMAYLSDNYSKQVFLMADRYVEVHASYGYHHRTRTPKNGRSIAYNHETCDLYVGATGPEIYRINLEQGRFLKSWTTQAPAVNKVLINDYYGMLAAGTTLGMVECFDPRARERIGVLDVTRGLSARAQRQLKGQIPAISTMTFMQDNLTLGVGTTGGQVLLYDIRAAEPVLTKDHSYGLPIKRIVHHAASDSVLAADQKVIKIWKRESGEAITAIEADADINDMDMYPDSGMFFVGGEQSKMMIYFVPSLGPAPKWCHYLDSITEELDDGAQPAVYDDYKFVTREELDALGLSSLVGTALLKAHMHGYFIDVRLYNEAKDASNPFAYEEYRQRLIRKKLEEGTESRLQLAKYRKELPKINRALAKRLVEFNENQGQESSGWSHRLYSPHSHCIVSGAKPHVALNLLFSSVGHSRKHCSSCR